jgi:hypothetical protein
MRQEAVFRPSPSVKMPCPACDYPQVCPPEGPPIDLTVSYAMRWKIETFHKILKSGCRAED